LQLRCPGLACLKAVKIKIDKKTGTKILNKNLPLRRSTAWPRTGWIKLKHSFTALLLPKINNSINIIFLYSVADP
jgi:hypothetical protein